MGVSLSQYAGAGAQFFDNNGNPLAGGKIHTYAAGTTTPLATYTSYTGGTANANPIVLDAAGRTPAQIWLTEGSSYKFELKTSADVTIKTDDNIFASYELDLTGTADTQVVFINGSAASGSNNLTFDGNILTVRSIEIGRGGGVVASNTAVGTDALALNSTGANTVAFGFEALYANTTGVDNTAVGHSSLKANTTGMNNVAVGHKTLQANTSGQGNTAVGADSLILLTTAAYNTAIGHQNAQKLSTGAENTIIGHAALNQCQSGNYNVVIGNSSASNVVSSNNVAVGYGSLSQAAGTAENNTVIGYSAGDNITSGSNNTVIGYDAKVSAGGVNNEITLGNSSITSLRVPGLTLTAGVKYINNGALTVATLPAAATAGAGARAVVTDANATTFHGIVAAGGANTVPVFSDGTNWRIG